MRLLSISFLCLFSVSYSLQILHTDESSCKATTDKGLIDLSPIAKTDKATAAFQTSFTIQGNPPITLAVYFNPCVEFTLAAAQDGCKNCEVCIEASDTYEKAGDKNLAKFGTKGDQVTITYVDKELFDVSILLQCDTGKDKLQYNTLDGTTNILHLKLSGKHACFMSTGLSAGSVLCIIALVLVILYLVVGVIIMKTVKKAEGANLIPNVDFWKSLPSVVKEGVMFIVRGCKVTKTYDEL